MPSHSADTFKFGMQNPEHREGVVHRNEPHHMEREGDDPLHTQFQRLHDHVHQVPPFSCRDVAELVVPVGFLGGSIMYLINEFTTDKPINGKTVAGDCMTLVASLAGTGLVLHNWYDRFVRRRREVNPGIRHEAPPLEMVVVHTGDEGN